MSNWKSVVAINVLCIGLVIILGWIITDPIMFTGRAADEDSAVITAPYCLVGEMVRILDISSGISGGYQLVLVTDGEECTESPEFTTVLAPEG